MKLSLLLSFSLLVAACDPPIVNPPPEKAAKDFAAQLNLPIDGVSCAQADTDRDGYVTCTLSIRGDKPRLESIQCASPTGYVADPKVYETARGCKMTKAIVTTP